MGDPDRVHRALRQDLRLLHRSHSTFFVLGATQNVYTINLSASPSCSCPDPVTPCKHILFILIRLLRVPQNDPFLFQKTYHPSELYRLLNQPTSPAALADVGVRRRFHRMSSGKEAQCYGDGVRCRICYGEMKMGERVLACDTCRSMIHDKCFQMWRENVAGEMVRCDKCRAWWSYDFVYLNLSG